MHNCLSCGAALAARRKYCDDCRDTAAPWRADPDAIEFARQHLGISVNVIVRRTATRKLLGRYHGIRLLSDAPRDPAVIDTLTDDQLNSYMHHYITVGARQTPESASRTLWHEMTHAAQYERDPDEYVAEYARQLAEAKRLAASGAVSYVKAYRMISFEIEAKANEDLHYTLRPLTVANKRASMPALKVPHSRIDRVVDGKIVPAEFADQIEDLALQSIETAKIMLSV